MQPKDEKNNDDPMDLNSSREDLSRYLNEEIMKNIRKVERLTGINNYLRILIEQKEEEHRQILMYLEQQEKNGMKWKFQKINKI